MLIKQLMENKIPYWCIYHFWVSDFNWFNEAESVEFVYFALIFSYSMIFLILKNHLFI